MATAVFLESAGPPPPCGALHGGILASPLAAPPTGGEFDGDSVVVSVGALVLLLAIGAVFLARRFRQRPGRGGWRVPVLAGVSLLFAALATAWEWRLRLSFSGGCSLSLNAAPFSEDQALSLAPLLGVVLVVLAAAWVAVAVRSALTRGVAKA